jgi:exosortase
MPRFRPHLAAVAAILLALGLAYWRVLGDLFIAWRDDGNYSHGFFIAPLAAWFAWEKRQTLAAIVPRPSWAGLSVVAVGLLLLFAGLLGAEFFVSRVSFVITLTGIVLFLFGRAHLRALAFPLAFLLLAIPPPALIFNKITIPLQTVASQVGEAAIRAGGVPVLREGNVLVLAHTSLEVAEACSGIRSLVSLITLGFVFGYFLEPRAWVRAVIVVSAIPVAIVANGARVAGTGLAAQWIGPEAAMGFFHEFSGWVLFVVALVLMLLVQRVVVRLAPPETVAA